MQKWVFLTPDEMKPPLDWVMKGGTPGGRPADLKMLWDFDERDSGDLPGPTTREQMENPDVLDISCRDEVHLRDAGQEPMPPPPNTVALWTVSPNLDQSREWVGKPKLTGKNNTCFEWEIHLDQVLL